MMKISGLIFDFDGLILDTELAEFKCWKEIFASYQAELPFKEWSVCIGTSNEAFDVFEYLEKQIGHKVNRDDIENIRQIYLNKYFSSLRPLPGVYELIREAKTAGLKIGLASSASYQWVSSHLTRLSLISMFDTIHTREEVVKVKPNPDLYLHAIKALGLSPKESVAFEDSPNGIKAAKSAGLFCVAVPNQLTMMMDTSQADIILPSLKDVSLAHIESYFESSSVRA